MRSNRLPFLLLTAILLLSAVIFPAEKRAFTIEDYYNVNFLSDLQLSPDSTMLAFKVTEFDLPKHEKNSSIWVINTDGNALRQFTSGENLDFSPRWSPDGSTLAFLSSRDDTTQLYLLPAKGGEARKLTDLSTSISDPIWSPDSSFIIFTSEIYPECGADQECNREREEKWDDGPSQSHLADSLLYRHWDSWKDGKRRHLLKIDLEGNLTDLTPGDHDTPEFSLGGVRYEITPDGKSLIFSSKRVVKAAESTNVDLWSISLEENSSFTPKKLTTNFAYDSTPAISPDGKHVAYFTQKIPKYEADLFRIALLDLSTGKSRLLTDTANFDFWVNHVEWSTNGKRLYFTAQKAGDTPFFTMDVKSGKISERFTHETASSFHVTRDDSTVYYIHRSIGEPTEVYKKSLKGDTRPERITFFNKPLQDEVDIRPAERIWVEGAGGEKVQVFIVKPHGFDPEKKYPLIVNVHGGPQMMWHDSFRGDWQVYPGAGYIVAFPNPHGSTGYGQAYTAQISGDWGGMVYEDVMKVTDHLEKLPYVDKERIGAMGWSYGGYMMNWILGHTDRYKCLVSMMGVYDLPSKYGATEELWFPEWDLKGTPWSSEQYRTFSPSNYVENFKTPTLVITGEKDYRVSFTQSLQLFTALQKMNVPSRLIVFENSCHWPNWWDMILYYSSHLDWFQKYLGGGGSPWDIEDFVANRVFDTETGERIDVEKK